MNAAAVIERLRELDARSGGLRVAWTDACEEERRLFMDWLRAEVPAVEADRDEAGNAWAVLPGTEPGRVVVGSHLDCVPGGGWLDGCLGVHAAAEALIALAREPRRRTLALVDWADEEGARFGHSLLGSSAAAGRLDVTRAAGLTDGDGLALPDALARCGVELERMPQAAGRLDGADAYAELHIEQGPVLDADGLPAAAVDGCLGVDRREFVFTGQAAHAGATPMRLRRDPVLAASMFATELRSLALEHGALATVGALRTEPGTPTAVAARVRLAADVRHADGDSLASMVDAAQALAERAAEAAGCRVEASELYSIAPIRFDAGLVERAAALVPEGRVLTSGPLHDAAAVALAGVPTVMLFARTAGGISHSREEDARDEDLAVAIEAFGALVRSLVLP